MCIREAPVGLRDALGGCREAPKGVPYLVALVTGLAYVGPGSLSLCRYRLLPFVRFDCQRPFNCSVYNNYVVSWPSACCADHLGVKK